MERRELVLDKQRLLDYFKRNYQFSNKILTAFKKVDRENFMIDEYRRLAYDDNAYPIVAGQTISQPSTVLTMLDMLGLKQGQKILEVGAGSGYNAALIASMVGNKGKVYTIEFLDEVYSFAKKNVGRAGLRNVKVVKGDGSKGYEKAMPYDRIIVTAACPRVPNALIKQLRDNGILVAPVGFGYQKMVKMRKIDGKIEVGESSQEYLFVPLKGTHGYGNL